MILDYLEAIMGEGTPHNTPKGMQYSFVCPLCNDHKERLFVNIDNKKYICHNCQSAGTIVTFIAEYNHITWRDALNVYREFEGYEIQLPDDIEEEIYSKLIQIPEVKVEKYVHPLPEEFTLIEHAHGKAGEHAVKYLKSRGITLSMAERYYIGYCAEGKYANRIIMPDFEDGDLVYWQARTWEPTPKSPVARRMFRKVLNPSLTREQVEQGIIDISKSEVISNIDLIKDQGVGVLCEGKMDAYTLLDYGGCLHGKSMSDTQFLKIVTNKDKIDTIYVMMDGDAFRSTLTIAERLSRYMDNVYVCKIPEDKDPNSLGVKGCIDQLTKAVKYNTMFQIKAQLKGWI